MIANSIILYSHFVSMSQHAFGSTKADNNIAFLKSGDRTIQGVSNLVFEFFSDAIFFSFSQSLKNRLLR